MFSRLSADIIDAIFTTVPDLATLFSLTLVTKDIHAVFETRPNSIIRAVADNQLGLALPQALRLVRSSYKSKTRLQRLTRDLLPGENDALKDPITRQEATRLDQNARVTGTLEALYSFRYKDIRTKTSQLTSVESLRFQRALYRFWLHCRLFSRWNHDGEDDSEDDDDNDDDDDDDEDNENQDQSNEDSQGVQEYRVKFFESFPTADLTELLQFGIFMQETAGWTTTAAKGYSNIFEQHSMTSHGPDVILRCYETCSLYSHDNVAAAQFETFPYTSLTQVLESRKAADFTTITSRTKIILNDVKGELEECDECRSPEGVMLWCSSNWHLLKGCIDRFILLRSLPGALHRNLIEPSVLRTHINQESNSIWDLVKELVQADSDDWSDGRTLCYACVLKLLGRHVLQWLIQQKALGNDPPQEDCWYGYNCRTQIHKYEHAFRLNHLCEPTRGDPV